MVGQNNQVAMADPWTCAVAVGLRRSLQDTRGDAVGACVRGVGASNGDVLG